MSSLFRSTIGSIKWKNKKTSRKRKDKKRKDDLDEMMSSPTSSLPLPSLVTGDSSYDQWVQAMRMVVRLPGGIPPEFRKKLWITLSEKYITSKKINWTHVTHISFNDRLDEDDESLGEQIIKDLHRTGCDLFSGDDAEVNQNLLKQVLLGYARWNKNVGYCQGFNILAAVILEVVEWDTEDSLMVMIFLIEGLLPESYFANSLRGLSVDMAVFRDLMKMNLPNLSRHLDHLQYSETEGIACYEPPLVNVFTLQWFLTLFSNCLPKSLVLRIWDLIFLEGNEILIRTALTIWDYLTDKILMVQSADEFYSTMGQMMRDLMEFGVTEGNELVSNVINMADFPFPRLYELRDKYSTKIRPVEGAAKSNPSVNNNNSPRGSSSSTSSFTHPFSFVRRGLSFLSSSDDDDSHDDDVDLFFDDQIMATHWTLGSAKSPSKESQVAKPSSFIQAGFLTGSPSATGTGGGKASTTTLDVGLLKKQYSRLRERQKQAHLILAEGFKYGYQSAFSSSSSRKNSSSSSIIGNHLILGKTSVAITSGNKASNKNHRRILTRSKQTMDVLDSDSDDKHAKSHQPERPKHLKGSRSESENVRRESKSSSVRVKRRFGAGVRRASSILEQSMPPSDERRKSQETLSWAEIRRRRKASAPVIRTLKLSEERDDDFIAESNKLPGRPEGEDGGVQEEEEEEDIFDGRQPVQNVNRIPSLESSTEDEQAQQSEDEVKSGQGPDRDLDRDDYPEEEDDELDILLDQEFKRKRFTHSRSSRSSSSRTSTVTELCDVDVTDVEEAIIIENEPEEPSRPGSSSGPLPAEDDKELEERITMNVQKEMSELSLDEALERFTQRLSSLSSGL